MIGDQVIERLVYATFIFSIYHFELKVFFLGTNEFYLCIFAIVLHVYGIFIKIAFIALSIINTKERVLIFIEYFLQIEQ